MAMSFQIFMADDATDFQAEHQDLLAKLEDYKNAKKTFEEGLSEALHIEDQDEREEKVLTLEVAKFQAELDYLHARFTLWDKIDEVFPFGSGDPQFIGASVPDENEHDNSSAVIFLYV